MKSILGIVLNLYLLFTFYRYGAIDSQQKCSLCNFPLVTRSFYFFPCSHTFHSDCLIAKVFICMQSKCFFQTVDAINVKIAFILLSRWVCQIIYNTNNKKEICVLNIFLFSRLFKVKETLTESKR